ncbi:hypothetical protein BY458DRAFT_529627 [Sporodiniella umbellata]|nr:hypothetical protein BY458DRAFT_529627 [Sporodiniella umbellata]
MVEKDKDIMGFQPVFPRPRINLNLDYRSVLLYLEKQNACKDRICFCYQSQNIIQQSQLRHISSTLNRNQRRPSHVYAFTFTMYKITPCCRQKPYFDFRYKKTDTLRTRQ